MWKIVLKIILNKDIKNISICVKDTCDYSLVTGIHNLHLGYIDPEVTNNTWDQP